MCDVCERRSDMLNQTTVIIGSGPVQLLTLRSSRCILPTSGRVHQAQHCRTLDGFSRMIGHLSLRTCGLACWFCTPAWADDRSATSFVQDQTRDTQHLHALGA